MRCLIAILWAEGRCVAVSIRLHRRHGEQKKEIMMEMSICRRAVIGCRAMVTGNHINTGARRRVIKIATRRISFSSPVFFRRLRLGGADAMIRFFRRSNGSFLAPEVAPTPAKTNSEYDGVRLSVAAKVTS